MGESTSQTHSAGAPMENTENRRDKILNIIKWWFILAILVLSFISVYYDLQTMFIGYDPLSVKLYEDDIFDVDGWSFLHVIFFGMIPAMLFPQHTFLFFVFGLLWEVVEYSMAKTLQNYSMVGVWEEQIKNAANDIVFNTSGLFLGLFLRGQTGDISKNLLKIVQMICIHGAMFLGFVWASAMQYPMQFHRALLFGFIYYVVCMHYTLVNSVGTLLYSNFYARWAITWLYLTICYSFYLFNESWSAPGLETLGYKLVNTPLDKYFTYQPIFWIPYVLFIPFTYLVPLISYRKYKMDAFPAAVIVFFISTFIMYLFPMAMDRPSLDEFNILNPGFDKTILGQIHEWVHNIDQPNNTFPSLHVSVTIICCLCLYQARYHLSSIVIGVIIILSTLFTKQHNVFDVIGGIIAAIVALLVLEVLHMTFEHPDRLRKLRALEESKKVQ